MNVTPDKFQKLLKANQILQSTLDLNQLLRQVMALATDVVEAESSSILLYDRENNELVFNLALTENESKLKEVRVKIGEGIAGIVAKERKAKIVNDIEKEPGLAKFTDEKIGFKTRSVLAVPLIYKDNILGVVEAVNKKNGGFTPEDTLVLEAFSAQAAVSLENARLFESLVQEKEKIEAVFHQMSDGTVYVDAAGKKILANEQAQKLLGKENADKNTISGIFGEFEAAPSVTEIMASKEKFSQAVFTRTKGKTLYLSALVSSIFDEKNSLMGKIIVFRDSTSEKKESMLKSNFLSLVSHKLKTPLVSITGYCPLLLSCKTLDDFQTKALTSIQRQGLHLASLVDKLLTFTILETENLVLNKTPLTFSFLIDEALASLRNYIEEHNAQITVAVEVKKLAPLNMDKEKMEAVIKNLLENAVKFNPGEKKTVEITPAREAGFLGLKIKDNGPGIPPEEREKIFQRFYQIEESFTGQVEGAGLGLALVRQIVKMHGGRSGVESSLGAGSTFFFLLPEGMQ